MTSESWGETAVPRVAGTEIFAYFEIDSAAEQAYRRGFRGSAIRLIEDFDPLLDNELQVAPAIMREVAEEIAESALCTLRVFASRNSNAKNDQEKLRFFSGEDGIEITLIGASLFGSSFKTKYRCIEVENTQFGIGGLLSLDVDVLCGKAPELLHLSRRDWTAVGSKLVADKVRAVLPKAIDYWLGLDSLEDQIRMIIQFEAAMRAGTLGVPGDWQSLEVVPDVSLRDLMTCQSVTVSTNKKEFSIESKNGYLIECSSHEMSISRWLPRILTESFPCVEQVSADKGRTYIFSRNESVAAEVRPEHYAEILARDNNWSGFMATSRSFIACPDRFSNLRSSLNLPLIFWGDPYFKYFALSPFRRAVSVNARDPEDPSHSWFADHLDAYVIRIAAGNGKSHAEVFAHLSRLFDELGHSEVWREETRLSLDDMKRELDVARRKLSLD